MQPTIQSLPNKLSKMEVKLKNYEKELKHKKQNKDKHKKQNKEDKQNEEDKPKELNKFFKKLKQANKGADKFVYKGKPIKKVPLVLD